MIKKIILITSLLISSTAFANSCHEPSQKLKDLSVSELKSIKKDLQAKLEQTDFDYYYTLTHNRIYIKSMNIQLENKLDKLKEVNSNNEIALEKIYSIQHSTNNNVKIAHKNIDEKTKYIYEKKKETINWKLNKVETALKDKTVKRVHYK